MRLVFKNKWIIGGITVCLILVLISITIVNDYTVYFYTPKEAVEQAAQISKKEIRVGGMVLAGTLSINGEFIKFTLSDLKGSEIKVAFQGTPPDLFKENSGAVVEGFISTDGKTMKATNLLFKHSEDYQIPKDIHNVESKLIYQSIIKNEKNAKPETTP